jgi:uncharacterized protein YlaI
VKEENIYASIDWFILRESVLEKYKWRCIVCGRYASIAHHLTYNYGVLCNRKWLIALCYKCHRKVHNKNESKSKR